MRTKQQASSEQFLGKIARREEHRRHWRRFLAREESIASLKETLARPLVYLPSMRRRSALLFVIGEFYRDFPFLVGVRGRPPYTADMRWLVGRGYLQLKRVQSNSGFERSTKLSVTGKGTEFLQTTRIPQADRTWIYQALAHGMLE